MPRILALLVLISVTISAAERSVTTDLVGLGGIKQLEEDDWGDLDNQKAFGLQCTIRPDSWNNGTFGIPFGFITTSDSATIQGLDFDGKTYELWLGLEAMHRGSAVQPFIGAGAAYLDATLEVEDVEWSDSAIGPWAHAGIQITIGAHFNIGAIVHWSQADVSDSNQGIDLDADAGGFSYLGMVGVRL